MLNNGDERNSDDKRKNDGERNNDDSVRTSFTDAELDNALAGFEREFKEESQENLNSENLENNQKSDDNQENDFLDQAMRNIEEANFEEDLQGLLGNKAKVALMVTYVQPAQLLAAFCKMASVSAQCFDEEQGAVAVLKNLDGNEPEEAVQKFVDFFRGMDVMLITNRADKLNAKVYEYNCEPQEIVAPMALAVWSRAVEDLAIGMETVETISKQNIEIFNSDELSDANAYELFQKYGKRK